jgi:hypothetical protein
VQKRLKTIFRQVRTYSLIFVTVSGTVLAGLASTGKGIEELKSLWANWTYKPPRLQTIWQGTWQDRDGYRFDFAMQLEVLENDSAKGRVSWKLIETPSGSIIARRIGSVASEFVSGTFDRKEGVAELSGNGVSDPTLLVTDHYIFRIHADKTSFIGKTKNHGDWEAQASGTVLTVAEH